MLRSQTTRMLALAAVTTLLLAVCTTTAKAAGPKRFRFDAGVASCFVPDNVYGGSGPTITAPSVRYRNSRTSSVSVSAFAIVVDASTRGRISYALIGTRRLARGASASFPTKTVPIPDRSASKFFPVGVHVQLDVRRRGSLIQIWTGVPSAYDTYTNGAFFPTCTGRASWC
jgi:hypothetical protein